MRQLDLLKGKRQRGIKAPPALEFRVHVLIADTLGRWCAPGWWWGHYPAGENRDPITGARLKRMGTKPGVSDFLLIAPPAARLHALELKREGEKPNPNQIAFLAAVEAAGGRSAWVDNYMSAIEVLCSWGALPDGKIKVQ